jgi:hypothetical protein
MGTTETFDEFKQTLRRTLRAAQATGLSEQQVVAKAEDVGDWLARNYDPRSPEQRLLKEMWSVSDEREQRAIASALVKLVGR